MSPNPVHFGYDLRIPGSPSVLSNSRSPDHTIEGPSALDYPSYVICNDDRRAYITELTATRQNAAVKRFSSSVRPVPFVVGDFVYVLEYEKHRKLAPQWSGPYRVIRRLRNDVFDASRRGHLLTSVHVDRLKRH